VSAAADDFEFDRGGGGAPPRHIDLETALLDRLARSWLGVQQHRKGMAQRELADDIVAEFKRGEDLLSRRLSQALRRHPLWPWLSQYRGLGGAHVALVIGLIGDPRRFPGQRCTEGHYLPPLYAVGAPCPIAGPDRESDGTGGDGAEAAGAAADRTGESEAGPGCCPGVMLPPRTTSGTRSLWHWLGLHVVEGRAPRKTKGQRCDWQPRGRASVMQPDGIADQIVRHGVRVDPVTGERIALHKYAAIYLETKARLNHRVADVPTEIEVDRGDAIPLRAAADAGAIDRPRGRPLRPFQADRIARKVAAKAFLADLLAAWKALA